MGEETRIANLSYIICERPDSFGSFESFMAAVRRVKELGYNGVELNVGRPLGFDIEVLAHATESLQLRVVSFLTGSSYFQDGLCLSSPRAEVRQHAVERLSEITKLAARFGAVMVVGQMQGFLTDEPDRALGETRIEESMKRVTEAAEQNGATIAFEPVNHLQAGFHNSLQDVVALADRIGSSHFRPMLDTFHMNIEENSMTEPIHRAGPRLAHFHLCESNGHALGTGHFDFKPIVAALRAIGYDGFVSVKAYRDPWATGAEASMKFLRAQNLAPAMR